MKDREFLIWLHSRMVNVHGESESYDYMRKLRSIIRCTPNGRTTPKMMTFNSLSELQEILD